MTPAETTVLQVAIREHQSFGDPFLSATVTFAVRMPKDIYIQELAVSGLRYEELLDRCWDVVKKSVMERYRSKDGTP